jgi:sphingolipid delta-4 desaturase
VGLAPGQPTNSYYGTLNWFSFFVGYHVEHHDFPGIPWYRLPALRRIASEHYDSLAQVRSLVGLGYRFLTDPSHGIGRYCSTALDEPASSAEEERAPGLRGAELRSLR